MVMLALAEHQRLSLAIFYLIMDKDDTKGDIRRSNLELHGIVYEPDVYQVHDLFPQSTSRAFPDQVDAVREALLSFENTIPQEWEEDLREDFAKFGKADIDPAWTHHPPSSAFIRGKHYERHLRERSADWTTAHEDLKCFEKIAKRARDLLDALEPEWNFFWRSEVFTLFSDKASKQSGFR